MCLKKVFDNLFARNEDFFYFIFRVFAGLLFAQHGAQKLLGWFGGLGGKTAALFSLFWFTQKSYGFLDAPEI